MNLPPQRANPLRRRANARNVSFRISLRWPILIINPVDKTKLSHFHVNCFARRLVLSQRQKQHGNGLLHCTLVWNCRCSSQALSTLIRFQTKRSCFSPFSKRFASTIIVFAVSFSPVHTTTPHPFENALIPSVRMLK